MAKPSANLRMFVAMYPPTHLSRQLLDTLGSLGLPPHRETPLEQVHLTLQFIGDVPANELEQAIISVQRACAGLGPAKLTIRKLVSLPTRGQIRLVAAEAEPEPTIMELHRRLAVRFAQQLKPRHKERFLPHLTLCRFQPPFGGVRCDVPITLPPVEIQNVSLMRSVLASTGARHVEVASIQLNQG